MRSLYWRVMMAAGVSFLVAAGAAGSPARAQRQPVPGAGLPAPSLGGRCLPRSKAYLRAQIRGAVRLDVDLRGAALKCEGGPRLEGGGLRMGFEGRVGSAGRVRMIFGISGARMGRPGRELPTNLTVIFEGRKLLFATQGDLNCTVDRLMQEPIGKSDAQSPPRGGVGEAHARPAAPRRGVARPRAYRVVAHGFCIAPVNDLSGRRRIVVTSFDFAGRVDFNTL